MSINEVVNMVINSGIQAGYSILQQAQSSISQHSSTIAQQQPDSAALTGLVEDRNLAAAGAKVIDTQSDILGSIIDIKV